MLPIVYIGLTLYVFCNIGSETMYLYELSKEQKEYLVDRGYSVEKKGVWSKLDEVSKVMLYIDLRHGNISTYGYTRDGHNRATKGDRTTLVQLKSIDENQSKLEQYGISTGVTV